MFRDVQTYVDSWDGDQPVPPEVATVEVNISAPAGVRVLVNGEPISATRRL